jgi:hypothetical protein
MRTLFLWIGGSSSSIPSHLWLRRLQEIQDGAIAATAYQSMVGKKHSLLAVQSPFFPLTFWRKFAPEKTKAVWNL